MQLGNRRSKIIGQGIGAIHVTTGIERKHEEILLDIDHLLMVRRTFLGMGANRQSAGAIWQRAFSDAAGNCCQCRILA